MAAAQTSRYAKGFDLPVRGDTITADRYISKEFMAAREPAPVAQGLASRGHGR